jgi:branched-subunit amino acid ABC-type transport system permease component
MIFVVHFNGLLLLARGLQPLVTSSYDRYLLQVRKDCDDLRAGLELLEIVIETIQATVTIRQAESERIFNKNIQTWGWGLAVASIFTSIVASSFGEFNSPFKEYLPLEEKLSELLSQLNLGNNWLIPAHIFVFSVVSFVLSLAVVLGIWFLLAKIFKFLNYLLRRAKKR